MKLLPLAAGVAVILAGPAAAAPLALVLDNAAYTGLPPLPACSASAGLVSRRLAAAGYSVTAKADLSNGAMGSAVADFAALAAASPKSPALVYVCGYGAALQGRDFVLPATAAVSRPTDLLTEGLLAHDFLAVGQGGRTAPTWLVLDLVRDPTGSLPPAAGALAREALPPGTGIAVVVETKPPSAPTELAALAAEKLAAAVGSADALTAITKALATGGGAAVAGVKDAASAVPPAAPPAPPPAAPAATTPAAWALPDDSAMTKADRLQVQIALATLGYYAGRLDGVFGADSRAAIRRWQHEARADMTGRLTAAEATRLVGAPH